jgi:hypothetical protein
VALGASEPDNMTKRMAIWAPIAYFVLGWATILFWPAPSPIHAPGLEVAYRLEGHSHAGSEEGFLVRAIIFNILLYALLGFIADHQKKVRPAVACLALCIVSIGLFQIVARRIDYRSRAGLLWQGMP